MNIGKIDLFIYILVFLLFLDSTADVLRKSFSLGSNGRIIHGKKTSSVGNSSLATVLAQEQETSWNTDSSSET